MCCHWDRHTALVWRGAGTPGDIPTRDVPQHDDAPVEAAAVEAPPATVDATPEPVDAATPSDIVLLCAVGDRPSCVSNRLRATCGPNRYAILHECPDRPAAAGRCTDGVCTIACAPGAYDCDDDPRNGCESRDACPSIMLKGFGGATGYGPDDQCVHPSDNDAYAGPGAREGDPPVPIDLAPAFPDGLFFMGLRPHAMFVNINGGISFGRPLTEGTPSALPVAGQAMIAPWWADVDTRGGGQPARNNVCFVLQPDRLVVTWDHVGYFDRHDDRTNSFQLVVRTDPEGCPRGSPIIEFRYARCAWTVGDASGDAHALAGFEPGNRQLYFALPQSRTSGINTLCSITNVPGGPPGLFRFITRWSGC